jgi:hypothetical protein
MLRFVAMIVVMLAVIGGGSCQSEAHTRTQAVVSLTKKIYASLDSKSANDLAGDFRGEYNELNMDGTLSGTLSALNEMRLEDLQLSVRHAKKMSELLNALTPPEEPNTAHLESPAEGPSVPIDSDLNTDGVDTDDELNEEVNVNVGGKGDKHRR